MIQAGDEPPDSNNERFKEVEMVRRWIGLVVVLLLVIAVHVEAAQRNVVMEIEGMSCYGCPVTIEKALKKVKGVIEAEVSFEKKKAWLTVDDSVTDKMLIDAVQKAGPYKGKVIEEPGEK